MYGNCFSIVKWYDSHLRKVHGLSARGEEYKDLLAETKPVTEMLLIDKVKGDRTAHKRDFIRQNCENVGAIPDFRGSSDDYSSDVYIAPSKCDLLIVEQNGSEGVNKKKRTKMF